VRWNKYNTVGEQTTLTRLNQANNIEQFMGARGGGARGGVYISVRIYNILYPTHIYASTYRYACASAYMWWPHHTYIGSGQEIDTWCARGLTLRWWHVFEVNRSIYS
jgi:hypothetical protein